MPSSIYTIGYEKRDVSDVFEKLNESGIAILLDVRWRPSSRKKGLSKSPLKETCDEHGLEYIHDRQLGTPPEILDDKKETGEYDWDAYEAFLEEQQDSLDDAAEVAQKDKVALLCYERNAEECHRRLVADKIAERTGLEVTHL